MAATALFLWSAREGMMGSSSSSLPEEEVEVEEPQLIIPDHRHQRQLEPHPDELTIVRGNDQDHDHHSRQQIIRPRNPTSKKKRKKAAAAEQKNKQPQRGLGVAQLEKLRLQERWKKITEIEGIHNTAAATGLLLPSASSSSASFQFQQFPPALYRCCRSGGAGSSTTSLGLYGVPWSEACFLQKHMTTYSNAAAAQLQHMVEEEEEEEVDRNVVANGSMLLPAAGYHNYQRSSSSYNSPGIGIGMNGVVVPSAELSSNQKLLMQYCALPSSSSSHSCYFCLKQENGTSMLGGSSSGENLQAYVGSNDLFYVQRFNNIVTHADGGNGQKEIVQGGFHDDDLRRRTRCEKEASSEVEEYQLFPCTNGVNTSGFSAGGDGLSSTGAAGATIFSSPSPTSFIDLTLKLSYS